MQSYANLIEGPLHTSQLIDEANLQFKVQVQEWKNVLLRGKQPADLGKYWGQFEDRQRDVQNILGELAGQKGIEPQAIESGQSRSEESLQQVTEAGAMLERITLAVEAIRDMNRQIATAAEEQTSVAEDISRNLTEITSIASTNLDNVQRTEAASNNLHGLSGQLNEVTARLSA